MAAAREELLALETRALALEEDFVVKTSSSSYVSQIEDARISSTDDCEILSSASPITVMKVPMVPSNAAVAAKKAEVVEETLQGTQPIKYSSQFATPPVHEVEKTVTNCRGLIP